MSASTVPSLEDIQSLLDNEADDKLLSLIESRLMYYSYIAGDRDDDYDLCVW